MAFEAPPEPAVEEIYLWPECEEAWLLFWQLGTQWQRAGMDNTRTGLSYPGVQSHLDELGYERGSAERRELWDLLLAAEREALDTWAKLREKDRELQKASGGA